jgi:CubicO group peptidase (beta-lactamase class C family)
MTSLCHHVGVLRGAVPAALILAACVWAAPGAFMARGQVSLANATRVSLDEALAAAAELPRLHSLLVSWRGALILERYFNGRRATTLANIKSASKSIISALVGIAIDRGHIPGVESTIGAVLPDQFVASNDPRRRITIEDLLTMRSGLESTSNRNYGAWVTSRNWVGHVLSRPLLGEPGTGMRYSTGNTHVLSAVLTKATGRSTWQFAQEALAKPLGFSLARWPRDPQGIYFGGNDMLMTPRQMVSFGELYLNRGRVRDLQLIPETWIEASWIPRGRSDFSEQLYGYGWWIREIAGQQAFYAWGYGGQFIYVIPSLDLVVVSTSAADVAEERRSHRRTVDEIVEHLIVQRLADG